MLTGNDSKETAIAALNAGADFYQNKGEDMEVQVLDLSHKVKVLVARQDAEDAAWRKDKILAAISYAAEHLLRGRGWQKDMEEVLGHLGRATRANSVFIAGFNGDGSSDPVGDLVTWSDSETGAQAGNMSSSFMAWIQDPVRLSRLSINQEILVSAGTLTGKDRHLLHAAKAGTLLLIPVFVDDRWWGVLGITDSCDDRVFSPEEVSALRMAAGVIGSARYRIYIEEFFRNPVEESLVGVFLVQNGSFVYVNQKFCEIFGYSRDEVSLISDFLVFVHPDFHSEVKGYFDAISGREIPSGHFEFAGIRAEGKRICLEVYLTAISCNGLPCLIGNVMDVTVQHLARKALAESEERFRDLFTNIRDMVLLHLTPGEGGYILDINQAVSDTLGYTRDYLRSLTVPLLCPMEHEHDTCTTHCRDAAISGTSLYETVFLRSDGCAVPVDLSTHRVVMRGRTVLLSVARDITERTKAEARIRAGEELLKRNILVSLREKETLLREIHHRVKNNMQIIISLLKLQDFRTDDPGVHSIIRDCRNRIYSMAIIHEKLYQTEELISIQLDDYVRDIAYRVMNEFEGEGSRVRLVLLGDDTVQVDISTGIPLGLIMNELITNCMKYAFRPGEEGDIRIDIRRGEGNLVINIADSGPGLPEGFDGGGEPTLGTQLVRGLAFQLEGTAVWSSHTGTMCTVTIPFPDNKVAEEP
jgi:PAS domain S-box-containing protein